MPLPEVMIWSAEDQAGEIRVGEELRLVGRFRFLYGAIGQGIYTLYNAYTIRRRENDLWDGQVTERSYFTARFIPWLPIPLFPRPLRNWTGLTASEVNARLADLTLLADPLTGPQPSPNPRLDPPSQPDESEISGVQFDPTTDGPFPRLGGGMPHRVSFVYKQDVARLGGWTENFWSLSDDLLFLKTKALDLAKKLALLHGHTSVCRYIRITKASPAGPVQPVARGADITYFQDTVNGEVNESEWSDYPTNALLLVCRDASGGLTRQWTKGIRDEFVQQKDGDTGGGGFHYKGLAAYTSAFGSFRQELLGTNNLWAIRYLDPAVDRKIVVSIDATGLVTTQLPHQLTTGVKVRISGGLGNTYANKIWRILAVPSTTTAQLAQWTPPTPFVPITGTNITIRLQSYKYGAINEAYHDFATSKYIGRPTRLLGFRSKARS